jgi:CheY-like chemotaxis protein
VTEERLVVVADDDEDILSLVSLRLQRLGYRVREAQDGAEPLPAIAAERPDVLVLDAMMPRVDGY